MHLNAVNALEGQPLISLKKPITSDIIFDEWYSTNVKSSSQSSKISTKIFLEKFNHETDSNMSCVKMSSLMKLKGNIARKNGIMFYHGIEFVSDPINDA